MKLKERNTTGVYQEQGVRQAFAGHAVTFNRDHSIKNPGLRHWPNSWSDWSQT